MEFLGSRRDAFRERVDCRFFDVTVVLQIIDPRVGRVLPNAVLC